MNHGIPNRIRRVSAARRDMTALVGHKACLQPSWTYGALLDAVDDLAAGFLALGFRPGDRVGIASENLDAWIAADLALLSIGVVDVPRGGDASAAEIGACFTHAGCRSAIFEDTALYDRVKDALPPLDHVIVLRGEGRPGIPTLSELRERGRAARVAGGDAELAARYAAVADDDLATIIYTSGTSGNPKGVMLTHANIMHNMDAVPGILEFGPGLRYVSFLPTWHTFERTLEYIVLDSGMELHYSSKRTLKADIGRVSPHFLAGVPRVWEMFHQAVLGTIEKLPGWKKSLVGWALSGSRRFNDARRRATGTTVVGPGREAETGFGPKIAGFLACALTSLQEFLARRFVYRGLHAALGGNRPIIISGGGPLPPEVDAFFLDAGVPLLNGYGLTETAPVLSVRIPRHNVFGTIGPPLHATDIRIVDESGATLPAGRKGVILARGPQVMKGYWNNPAATAACLRDGWFDTGDLGMLTQKGSLVIVGRAKDTIVLRGGENVEPANIETALMASPLIADAMVVGHGRKALGVFVLPDWDVLKARGVALPDDPAARAEEAAARKAVKDEVVRIMAPSNGWRGFEQITKVALLAAPFSPEDGTLTATLKKKRNVIEERFAAAIDAMFDDA